MCFFELVFTSTAYMRQVCVIDPAWLVELAPHMYSPRDVEDGEMAKRRKPKAVGRVAVAE